MLTVLALTIRQLTGTRRQAILWLFAALPLALVLLIRSLTDTYDDFFVAVTPMFDLLLVGIILPLVVAILATTALGQDIEDRTLAFIVLRPLPRWQIVAAKYIAVVALAAVPLLLLGAAMGAATFIGGEGDADAFDWDLIVRPTLGVVAGLAVGVIAYSAAFLWLGLISGQALGIAIVYVFVWEGVAAGIFSGIQYLSVRSYSVITMREAGGDAASTIGALGDSDIGLTVALVGAGIIALIFLGLTLSQLRNMDVP